jgi:hypothetical protein
MTRKLLLVTMALLAFGILFAGCELEADKEAEMLPTRGVGTTFKLLVDDIGPLREKNESGHSTDRAGFYYDIDHNALSNGDKVKDYFYQLEKPTVGIIGLAFGDDGFASFGKPIAMAKIVPGKEEYEIPLDSIKEWVKADTALGYRPGQYIDEPNSLVYENRVNGEEVEAPMTGETTSVRFRFQSLGSIAVGGSGTASTGGYDEAGYDETTYEEGYDTLAFGEKNARCAEWTPICDKEDSCGMFKDGWGKSDCLDRMYNYYDGAQGAQYLTCLKGCAAGGGGCDSFESCQRNCEREKLTDVYGCGGSYGPDVLDVFYVVSGDNGENFAETGVTIKENERLAVYVEYADVECNMDCGYMTVAIDGQEYKLDLPCKADGETELGCNSSADRKYIGFTFENPISDGEHAFTVSLTDGEWCFKSKYHPDGVCRNCAKTGEVTYSGSFVVEDGGSDVDDSQITFDKTLDFFEVYAIGLNKYNLGTGFIDIRAISSNYLFNFEDFDFGFIQGYLWSFLNTHNLGDLNINDLNRLIFTTTQDVRHTKYDDTDDIGSYAFYIDQPMSSGLFTFYGDPGWNIYPKAPYGAGNDDQPFIRGDFETTQIYVPMKPFYTVNPKYSGCGSACEYWIDLIYDTYRGQIDSFGDDKDGAFQSCQQHFADDFWSCRVDCWNRADEGINGCVEVDDCVNDCPGSPGNDGSWCDAGATNLELKLRFNVDPTYLENCLYKKLFFGPESDKTAECVWDSREIEEWEPVQVGLFGISSSNALEPVPDAYAPVNYPQSDFVIQLPFGPKMPLAFLPITDAQGSVQGQMYLAAFTKDGTLLGTGFYPPDDNNDEDWGWLVIYSYNWSGPELEGWSLSTIAGNSITSIVNPFDPIIELNFGDLRALEDNPEDQWLDPNAEELPQ